MRFRTLRSNGEDRVHGGEQPDRPGAFDPAIVEVDRPPGSRLVRRPPRPRKADPEDEDAGATAADVAQAECPDRGESAADDTVAIADAQRRHRASVAAYARSRRHA